MDLENFIRFRNLPQMTIKMVERKTNKGRVVLHDCNIKVKTFRIFVFANKNHVLFFV